MSRIIVLVLGLILWIGYIFGWSYPLKAISKPECKYKYNHYKQLPSSCKISLPKIYNGNYKKYKSKDLYRAVYSVLWLSTYKNGWDYGKGSHLGVDIATIKGTPVYAIQDGYVEFAGWKLGWGNVVVIKHRFKGKYIRSIYAHLNKIYVKKGQYVKEGKQIGEVGNTGFSFGNHLHFQIDISQSGFHPYYYNGCGSETVIVNKGLCQNLVILNTTDPILFIEKKGSYLNFSKIKKIANKIANSNKKIHNSARKTKKEVKTSRVNNTIKRNNTKKLVLSSTPASNVNIKKQVVKPKVKPKTKEEIIQEFLTKHRFSFSKTKLVVKKGATISLVLYLNQKYKNRPYKGSLPYNIRLGYDKNIIFTTPASKISYIDNGKRIIKVYGKKVGKTNLFVRFDNKVVKVIPIQVIDTKQKVKVKSATAKIYGSVYLGSSNVVVVNLKDQDGNEIRTKNFDDKINIYVENAYICKVNIKSAYDIRRLSYTPCDLGSKSVSMDFYSKDTLNGKIIFKIYPRGKGIVKVYIRDKSRKLIGQSFPKMVGLPKDFNKINSIYKKVIEFGLRQGYVRNYRDGYFSPDFELRGKDLKLWLKSRYNVNIKIGDYEKITYKKFYNIVSKYKRNLNLPMSNKVITRQDAAYYLVK